MRRAVTGGSWWLSPGFGAATAVLPAVLAAFVSVHQLTLHDTLHGVVFNSEGQGLGSALAISKGTFPYRSFALAQPPGFAVLLLPFAWIAHGAPQSGALEGARVLTVFATVAAVYLTGLAARGYGIPAAMLAGVFTATYPFEFFSTAGVTDGPWILLFTMIGVNLAFKEGELASGRRLVGAGFFIGWACAIKPWAILPAVVLLLAAAALWERRRSVLAPLAAGTAAGVVLPCVVFFASAPGAFVRDVVLAELPGHGSEASGSKLAVILGLGQPSGFADPGHAATLITFLFLAAVLLTCAGLYGASGSYEWFVALSATGLLLAALLPGTMALQYGEFAHAFLGLAAGVTVTRLLGLLASSWTGQVSDMRSSAASAIAVLLIACSVVIAAVCVPAIGRYNARYANDHGFGERAVLDGLLPAGTCALSNDPAYLIFANRFDTGAHCPVLADPGGLAAIGSTGGGAASASEAWQAALEGADRVILTNPAYGFPSSSPAAAYFHSNFYVAQKFERITVYTRQTVRPT